MKVFGTVMMNKYQGRKMKKWLRCYDAMGVDEMVNELKLIERSMLFDKERVLIHGSEINEMILKWFKITCLFRIVEGKSKYIWFKMIMIGSDVLEMVIN